jgi:ubiquinone/menaquinone biosynthesis C-methylase UbiE
MGHVCPWWSAAFTLDIPIRRWLHAPERVVGCYARPGTTVIEVGCGSGWFTIPMARMVGEQGRVIAVDLQQQMLDIVRRRAEKASVADRIELHKCEQTRLGIETAADFALVFAMLHEVPDQDRLLGEVYHCLKPRGKLLLAEPPIHVTHKKFLGEVAVAEAAGFEILGLPHIRWSHATLFVKEDSPQNR